ncbi:MAG: DNA adenine methylase [Clostridiales bacterium]|nr:DNA adenine methylase [Clostridiales bacterium]
MNGRVPHIVQYQGSKRMLAPQILQYMPKNIKRLIEPFSGMAAITVASAYEDRAERYVVNDLNTQIIELLECAIHTPETLIERYSRIWCEQFEYPGGHLDHFYNVRDRYNSGEHSPEIMLYLLARCVKGAVRYGRNGKFNQSPDKRRNGTNPKNIAINVRQISHLLKGRIEFLSIDYKDILAHVQPGDLIYMDPPYQGVSNVRDNRYYAGVEFEEFVRAIEMLSERNVDYIISYDGSCGEKSYGKELPSHLNCTKVMLNAGLSSQATLLGRRNMTYEALYLSEGLSPIIKKMPEQICMWEQAG